IILILVLVIVVIANLLDSEVQRGPTAEQQVTGTVPEATASLQGTNQSGAEVGTSGQRNAVERAAQGQPAVDSKTTAGSQPAVEGPSNVPLVDNVAVKPALARTDQVGLTPAAGVIRNDQGIDPVVVNRQGPDRGTASRVTPATKPVVPVMTRIEVQQGDSLWAIASRELGGGIHWPELLKVNPGLEELTILVPGRMLTIPNVQRSPTVRAVAATRPTVSTREGVRLYQIRDGDTLYDIARDELGNGGRWMEILKLNDGLDPNALPIGRKIFVPR
ncbi:MAG: LysM domain-containing protein, partial [Planctomycetota bacterium]